MTSSPLNPAESIDEHVEVLEREIQALRARFDVFLAVVMGVTSPPLSLEERLTIAGIVSSDQLPTNIAGAAGGAGGYGQFAAGGGGGGGPLGGVGGAGGAVYVQPTATDGSSMSIVAGTNVAQHTNTAAALDWLRTVGDTDLADQLEAGAPDPVAIPTIIGRLTDALARGAEQLPATVASGLLTLLARHLGL